jgi:hypothetical protein
LKNELFMIIYIVGGRKKLEERRVRQDKMIGVKTGGLWNGEALAYSVKVSRPRTSLKESPL